MEQSIKLNWDIERKHWLENLNISYEEIAKNSHDSELGYAKTAVSFIINSIFREGPHLFEIIDGRSKWERYISGIRFLLNNIEHSFLLNNILPMFKLGGASGLILSWCSASLEQMNALHFLMIRIESYIHNLEYAYEHTDKKEFSSLYASLKTWDTEEKLLDFSNKLNSVLDKPFEIYIEGPIQLMLMLSKEHFFFFVKAILAQSIPQLLNNGKTEEKDLQYLNDSIYNIVSNSKTITYFQELLQQTAKKSIELWIKEQRDRRSLIPLPSGKKRFLENFEQGYIQ